MSENFEKQDFGKKRWYTRWWAFLLFCFLIMVFAFLPLFLFQFFRIYSEVKSGNYVPETDLTVEPPYQMSELLSATSPVIGAENPKVTIVVFGDFNCAKSKQSAEILKELLAKNQDILKIQWRNFPVLSENSYNLAEAGICANKQALFWPIYDLFWQSQGQIQDQEAIWNLLIENGLNKKKLESCLNNKLTEAEIKKDYFLAKDLVVSGTPTFFVNGYRLQGVIPLTYWEEVIKKLANIYDKKNNAN